MQMNLMKLNSKEEKNEVARWSNVEWRSLLPLGPTTYVWSQINCSQMPYVFLKHKLFIQH